MGRCLNRIGAAWLAIMSLASAAQALAVYSFEEVGDDLVGTLTGALLIDDSFVNVTLARENTLTPDPGGLSSNPGFGGGRIHFASSPGAFGIGGLAEIATDQSSGDLFAVSSFNGQGFVVLSPGYQSGAPLNATLLFEDVSLADLGIAAGSSFDFVLDATGDIARVTFAAAAVPLPAGFALLAGALRLLAGIRRKPSERSRIREHGF